MLIIVQFFVCSIALALSLFLFKRARGASLQPPAPQTTPGGIFFQRYFKWFWIILATNWALTLLAVSISVWIKPIWAFYAFLWLPGSTLLSFPFCWIYFAIAVPRAARNSDTSKSE